MKKVTTLTIDDVDFNTMPAGSVSVKGPALVPIAVVNVFFIAFL